MIKKGRSKEEDGGFVCCFLFLCLTGPLNLIPSFRSSFLHTVAHKTC